MTPHESVPKIFSPEEANQLLPEIQQLLRQLRADRDEVLQLEKKRAVEELSWLEPDGTVSPRAQGEVDRLTKVQQQKAKDFETKLRRFDAFGVQLKDLDEGLVDFFTARGDTLVYLCWKDGEDQVRFWHELETGFSGRRPLGEL